MKVCDGSHGSSNPQFSLFIYQINKSIQSSHIQSSCIISAAMWASCVVRHPLANTRITSENDVSTGPCALADPMFLCILRGWDLKSLVLWRSLVPVFAGPHSSCWFRTKFWNSGNFLFHCIQLSANLPLQVFTVRPPTFLCVNSLFECI